MVLIPPPVRSRWASGRSPRFGTAVPGAAPVTQTRSSPERAITVSATAPAGTRRAVWSTAGRRATVARPAPSAMSGVTAPARARSRAATACSPSGAGGGGGPRAPPPGGGGGQAAAKGLHREREVEQGGAAPAVGLRERHARRAGGHELLPHLRIEAEGFVVPQSGRRGPAVGERTEHLDDRLLFVGELEVHRAPFSAGSAGSARRRRRVPRADCRSYTTTRCSTDCTWRRTASPAGPPRPPPPSPCNPWAAPASPTPSCTPTPCSGPPASPRSASTPGTTSRR